MTCNLFRCWITSVMSLALLSCVSATAAENEEIISLGEGKLLLNAPEKWVRSEPKVRIVEHEFAVEGKKGQDAGRVTVMGAGGTIEANIERWITQFAQPDGSRPKTRPRSKRRNSPASRSTLSTSPGLTKTCRPDPSPVARRLIAKTIACSPRSFRAARIVGNYFIKFYGPAEVVKENEKAFHKMVESLEKEMTNNEPRMTNQ